MKPRNLVKLLVAATIALPTIAGAAPSVRGAVTVPAEGITERLIAAIKGKSLFASSDFVEPLADADKRALRQFGSCDVEYIGHPADESMDHMTSKQMVQASEVTLDPNRVLVRFECAGVPRETPVGLTLHLQSGKIAKVEAHNADLMQAH